MTPRSSAVLAAAFLLAASARADVGGTWTGPLAPLPTARQELGAARVGDSVYVVGGLVAGTVLQATGVVERYGISANAWSPVAPLPAPRDHLGVCAHGGIVYAIGGFAGDFVAKSEVWAFDPALGTWAPRAPLPSARGGCWAVTHGSRVYVFGGVDAAGATRATTFVYDPLANSWSQGADMPTAREHLMAEPLGPFVYVIGGRTGAAFDVNERYDPLANAWTSLTPMPTARAASGIAAFDGRILVLGGETPVLHSVVESFDPVSGTWSRQEPMPVPRHGFAAIALDDRLLAPGGGVVQGLQATAHVDAFFPLSAQAQHVCTCGAAGPCGNNADERGCANSTGAGGSLTATGSASVSSDTLVLRASKLPPATSALFFQGTSLVNAGTGAQFGDGLRCVGGSVIRLSIRPVVGGAAEYPSAGDPTVSVRGLVPPGSRRHYQVWYRNPAGPCGSGSNLTNAVSVGWDT